MEENYVLTYIMTLLVLTLQEKYRHSRPERLIDLIVNRDYWEIIDV